MCIRDRRLLHGLLAEDQSNQWKSGVGARAEYRPSEHGYSYKSPREGKEAYINRMAKDLGVEPNEVAGIMNNPRVRKEYPDDVARYHRELKEASAGGAEAVPHEIVHATGFDIEVGDLAKGLLGKQKPGAPNPDYYSRPAEIYGNLFDIRRKLKVKPGERLTPKQFQQRVKKYGIDKDEFYQNYDPKKMLETLNTVAEVNDANEARDSALARLKKMRKA